MAWHRKLEANSEELRDRKPSRYAALPNAPIYSRSLFQDHESIGTIPFNRDILLLVEAHLLSRRKDISTGAIYRQLLLNLP